MTIGTSTEIETCQIRGQVSRDSHCWTKLLQKDTCGTGRDWQKSTQHHVQITFGLTLGQELEKPLGEENKNGQSRNRNSNTPVNWEEFILLIRVTRNTKKSFRMQGESWRHQKQLQCHVKERFLMHAYGKPLFQKQKKPRHLKQRQDSVVQLYHWSPWIHKTKKSVSNEKDSWRAHPGKRAEFCVALQFRA